MEAAVNQTKVPLVVHGVDKVDHRVEGRHAGLSKGQVHLRGEGGGVTRVTHNSLHAATVVKKRLHRLSFTSLVTSPQISAISCFNVDAL